MGEPKIRSPCVSQVRDLLVEVRHRLRDVEQLGPIGRPRSQLETLAGLGNGDDRARDVADDVVETNVDKFRRRAGFSLGFGRCIGLFRLDEGCRPDSEVVGVVQRQKRRQVDEDVVRRFFDPRF